MHSTLASGAPNTNRSAVDTAEASGLLQAVGLLEHTLRLTDRSKQGTECQLAYAVLRPARFDSLEALVLVTPIPGARHFME